MADTETVPSSIPTPYTSSFKGLLTDFPLFLDHLNSPSRPGPVSCPGVREQQKKQIIIFCSQEKFLKFIWSHQGVFSNKPKFEGQPPWWEFPCCHGSGVEIWEQRSFRRRSVDEESRQGVLTGKRRAHALENNCLVGILEEQPSQSQRLPIVCQPAEDKACF